MKKSYAVLGISLAAIVGMGVLAGSIKGKEEERQAINQSPVVKEKGIEAKNEVWGQYFPREYNSWKLTKKSDNINDLLKAKPQLIILWAGYGFAKDYNAPRGHFYAVQDVTNTLRTGAPTGPTDGPQPAACWSCKSPDVLRLIDEKGEKDYFTGKWARWGNEVVNPIGCGDCHDSKTANLKVSRPWLIRGLESMGKKMSDMTHQDMRSLVCAQCHSEYYFDTTKETGPDGAEKITNTVTFPWKNGFKGEEVEAYYDSINFKDFTNPLSKAPILKAQHPEYETFASGIHFQRGLACADCHMPYKQEGAVKYTDHNIGNPLDNVASTCLTCHQESEAEFKRVVAVKLERKEELQKIAMDTLAKAHLEAKKAWDSGATEEEMKAALQDIRHGQWRWDYSIASHGAFFHAPEETLRLLAQANELGQEARIKIAAILAKHGVIGYEAPDFSTKEKALALIPIDLAKEITAKQQFQNGLLQQWQKEAIDKGLLNPQSREGMSNKSSYSGN
ncbi:MAG: ammonia-forming cytochrome c nitrite reductase [Desulfobulbaceae bacterium]|jgi:nitrite reductase (cytochrome c-552)|nr:ammonia-forming cytochrome c nitrite reductase [Desulfobulbaceae bacterium]